MILAHGIDPAHVALNTILSVSKQAPLRPGLYTDLVAINPG